MAPSLLVFHEIMAIQELKMFFLRSDRRNPQNLPEFHPLISKFLVDQFIHTTYTTLKNDDGSSDVTQGKHPRNRRAKLLCELSTVGVTQAPSQVRALAIVRFLRFVF